MYYILYLKKNIIIFTKTIDKYIAIWYSIYRDKYMYYIWHDEDGVSVICIITRTLSRGLWTAVRSPLQKYVKKNKKNFLKPIDKLVVIWYIIYRGYS